MKIIYTFSPDQRPEELKKGMVLEGQLLTSVKIKGELLLVNISKATLEVKDSISIKIEVEDKC